MWVNDDEMWPARCPSEPNIILEDDELIDAKKLVPDLSFIDKKDFWGVYFQGSIRTIPEEDFRLIESEMKKIAAERQIQIGLDEIKSKTEMKTEKEYEELMSAGLGFLVELGDNFRGAMYYGYPLTHTDDTRTGKGRLNAGVMYQF